MNDPERDELDDGIKASGLIQDARLVPGFFKVDGYSYIRKQLIKNFDVTPSNVNDDNKANFFEFAYDWRRDNRVAARLLQKLINKKLPRWLEVYPQAKVILIAHSMGGLVARYYLEHLGGAQHCKALITLGTPYRGSVKILEFLANGYQKRPLPDLTEVVRSFTSAYQLLPIYPMINVGANWQRVSQTDGIPGVVKKQAQQGREFFLSLKGSRSYTTKPIIGVGQKSTFQSAQFSDGKLKVSKEILPPHPNNGEPLFPSYCTGDDTVPLVSAIPLELSSNELQDVPLIECHGSLQSNPQVWNLLKSYLMRLQDTIEDFQNPMSIQAAKQTAGISLTIDDLYLFNEPVELGAEIINVEPETLNSSKNFGGLNARITPVSGSGKPPVKEKFKQENDTQYKLILDPFVLAPRLYYLEVETGRAHELAPKAVHDLFQVMG